MTTLSAPWLVGCDGGRSTVRGAPGFGFPGTAAPLGMFLADLKGALGHGLRHALCGLAGPLRHPEVDRETTQVAAGTGLDVTEAGQQTPLVEHLHRAGGSAQPARFAGPPRQYGHACTGEPQFGRQCHARGAGTRDEHIGVPHWSPRSHSAS
ncbi:hypothetical protein GCM10023323_36960 [Streptomyces thinghirensis]|uniref:FAD-binding domain-containing protein n=1 Tax=Streptomyces thinghirensis TaxID=551547 RepID=A0ABP9T7M8_9ACTN